MILLPRVEQSLLRFIVSILVLVVIIPGTCASDLDWPELNAETKPWSRWWWLGNIGRPEEFASEMEKYAAEGLGGLEITPIYGVVFHPAVSVLIDTGLQKMEFWRR